MIVCAKCGYENKDSAMYCVECRINLKWAQENLEPPESKPARSPAARPAVQAQPPAPAEKPRTRPGWEFKRVFIPLKTDVVSDQSGIMGGKQVTLWFCPTVDDKADRVWEAIQEHGAQGWELVAAVPCTQGRSDSKVNIAAGVSYTTGIWCFLKRPLPETV